MMVEEIKISDLNPKVGNSYIITGYRINKTTCFALREEWECLKITPKGGVKFKIKKPNKKIWTLPNDTLYVFDVIESPFEKRNQICDKLEDNLKSYQDDIMNSADRKVWLSEVKDVVLKLMDLK